MSATALNAEAIRDLTDRASRNLMNATIELKRAVELAENDYAHNADRLRDALGTLRLAWSVVGTENSTWAGYARARLQAEEPK